MNIEALVWIIDLSLHLIQSRIFCIQIENQLNSDLKLWFHNGESSSSRLTGNLVINTVIQKAAVFLSRLMSRVAFNADNDDSSSTAVVQQLVFGQKLGFGLLSRCIEILESRVLWWPCLFCTTQTHFLLLHCFFKNSFRCWTCLPLFWTWALHSWNCWAAGQGKGWAPWNYPSQGPARRWQGTIQRHPRQSKEVSI